MTAALPKTEKLKWERSIKLVFSSKNKLFKHPIRVTWTFLEQTEPIKILVGCPKRNIKSAVHRNRIKRLLREAYRINKSQITEFCIQKNVKIGIAFIFLGNEIPTFEYTNDKVKMLLQETITQIEKIQNSNEK
jgi:ribonuclease P protein component